MTQQRCQYDFSGLSQSEVRELYVKIPENNGLFSTIELLNHNINIMIPNVSRNTSARYIYQKFIDLNIGVIHKIRFEQYSETSPIKRAYVCLYGWFYTIVAENIQKRMVNKGIANVIYNDPHAWKLCLDVSDRIYSTDKNYTLFCPTFNIVKTIEYKDSDDIGPPPRLTRNLNMEFDEEFKRVLDNITYAPLKRAKHMNRNNISQEEMNAYDELLDVIKGEISNMKTNTYNTNSLE